jgi:hypothetical protein
VLKKLSGAFIVAWAIALVKIVLTAVTEYAAREIAEHWIVDPDCPQFWADPSSNFCLPTKNLWQAPEGVFRTQPRR